MSLLSARQPIYSHIRVRRPHQKRHFGQAIAPLMRATSATIDWQKCHIRVAATAWQRTKVALCHTAQDINLKGKDKKSTCRMPKTTNISGKKFNIVS